MEFWFDQFFAKQLINQFGEISDHSFLTQLMKSAREGHLCMESLPIDFPEGMSSQGTAEFPRTPIVFSNNRYYLQRNWVYESCICQEISRLNKKMPSPVSLEALEESPLLPVQKQAIYHAANHQLTFIAGGPGTGKTYTASYLVQILTEKINVKQLYKICIAAPTGKAAQHLFSSLKKEKIQAEIQAETLHRLLKIYPGSNPLFQGQKIDADLVIVDEASMIEVSMWASLLKAIGPTTRLVLMGDPDQLPPVGAGSLFADLSEIFALRLERCMRTDVEILQNFSKEINEGNYQAVSEYLQAGLGSPFFMDLDLFYKEISPPCFKEPPDSMECIRHYNRFRILNALRQGSFGVDQFNEEILQRYIRKMRWGDYWAIPILINANDSRLDLYNGTTGVLMGQFKGAFRPREGMAYFPQGKEGVRSYNPTALPPFEWAFCLSIHKSQGSEFEKVFALFPPGSEQFGREALYTAVTRAKKELKVWIDPEVLRETLSMCSRKTSGIRERLPNIRNEIITK